MSLVLREAVGDLMPWRLRPGEDVIRGADARIAIERTRRHDGRVAHRNGGLYAFLQNAIAQANNALNSVEKGQTSQITFGSELLAANGNIGTGLLKPQAIDGVRVYLDGLQSLHVGGVTVAVSYPLILSRFPSSAQYLAFFEAIAQEVHSRAMKLDIETGPIFPDQGITVSYRGLTASRYASDKNEIAQTIINQLQPDYLNLGSEPDTEAKLLSAPVLNTPAGWTPICNSSFKRAESRQHEGRGRDRHLGKYRDRQRPDEHRSRRRLG